MNIEVYQMLEKMYTIIKGEAATDLEAWDTLVEFIALDNAVDKVREMSENFDWLHQDGLLEDKLMPVYNPLLLKSDYYDHLGDLYQKHLVSTGVVPKESRLFRTQEHAEALAAFGVPRTMEGMSVLDPHMESGRLLMAIHARAPSAILMGASDDLRMYRIAYTNFAIHGLKGYLLHADKNKHDIFIENENGQHNWRYANSWQSQMHMMLPRTNSPPPNWKGVSISNLNRIVDDQSVEDRLH